MLCCTSHSCPRSVSRLQHAIENAADNEPVRTESQREVPAIHGTCCLQAMQASFPDRHTSQPCQRSTTCTDRQRTPCWQQQTVRLSHHFLRRDQAVDATMAAMQLASCLAVPQALPHSPLKSHQLALLMLAGQDCRCMEAKEFWDTMCHGVLGAHVHSSRSCQTSALMTRRQQATIPPGHVGAQQTGSSCMIFTWHVPDQVSFTVLASGTRINPNSSPMLGFDFHHACLLCRWMCVPQLASPVSENPGSKTLRRLHRPKTPVGIQIPPKRSNTQNEPRDAWT